MCSENRGQFVLEEKSHKTAWGWRLGFLLLVLLLGTSRASAQAAQYKAPWMLTDLAPLGTLGDTDSYAVRINASGQVLVVSSIDGSNTGHAYVWAPQSPNATPGPPLYLTQPAAGFPLPLPPLGTCTNPANPYTGAPASVTTLPQIPFAMNQSGEVVGSSFTATSDGTCLSGISQAMEYPSFYSPGQYLGPPTGYADVDCVNSASNFATDVNNAGQIVGFAQCGNEFFIWLLDGQGFHFIAPLFNQPASLNIPNRIGNDGTIVGQSGGAAFAHKGYGPVLLTEAFIPFGGQSATATAINSLDWIVGNYLPTNANGVHAFLVDAQGNTHDLGTASSDPNASSYASAINNPQNSFFPAAVTIVGSANVDPNRVYLSNTHAVIWETSANIIDLNSKLDPTLSVPASSLGLEPTVVAGGGVVGFAAAVPCPKPAGCWELMSANDINDKGQIVGMALVVPYQQTRGHLHGFLLTPPCISYTNAAGQTIELGGDSDGDGICDYYEINGYDAKDGTHVDLPGMGANPYHKDIFVQIDYLETQGFAPICFGTTTCPTAHTHKPKPDAMDLAVLAFANAPVANPDGNTGITLHIDCGSDCVMDPVRRTTWGNDSCSNAWPEQIDPQEVYPLMNPDGTYNWGGPPDSDGFINQYIYTNDCYNLERAPFFHYFLFAHDIETYTNGISSIKTTGATDGAPAAMSIVSLGERTGAVGSVFEQAGTFMHELGHQLGLNHGGQDPINNKPNYLSVMNYSFQFGLLTKTSGIAIDYSEFSAMPPLNEVNLNEVVGLNDPTEITKYQLGTAWYCPGYTSDVQDEPDQFIWNGLGSTDWNCDNSFETSVQANIDGNPNCTFGNLLPDPIPSCYTLYSYPDWPNLVYMGDWIGQFGITTLTAASTSPQEGPVGQLPLPYLVQAVSPGIVQLTPGSTANLTFTLTNAGTQADTYNISVSSPYAWYNGSAVPASVTLASGASQQIALPVTVPPNLGCANTDSIQAPFSLKAVSQTVSTIFDTGVAEVFLMQSQGTVLLPSVAGLPQADAEAAIVAAGLAVGSVTTQPSASVPTGNVISQSPIACGFTTPGASVSIVVSSGLPMAIVPNVVGETVSMAIASLTAVGLQGLETSNTFSTTVASGIVVSQSTAAGTSVDQGSTIGLVVSVGPPPVTVPNVVGDSLAAATTALGDVGLPLGTVTGYTSSTIPVGTVISQEPVAGSSVLQGYGSVSLVVSVGSSSEAVVPNIVGETQTQAQSALSAVGLLLGTVANDSSTTVPAGEVISQTPLPGTVTATLSQVRVAISAGPQPYVVPNLYGEKQAQASTALTAAGLELGTVTPYPWPQVVEGTVFTQTVAPGTYTTAGASVGIYVATETSDTAPNLVGSNFALAPAAITGAGLTVGTFTEAASSTVAAGFVISQSPAAGAAATPESAVNVVFSAGSQLITVPNVVGLAQDNATQTILGGGSENNFYATITRQSSTTVPDGVVISQSPAGGAQAMPYSTVSLVVSSGGPVTAAIPNVVGTQPTETYSPEATIFAAGFSIGSVTRQPSTTVPEGTILSQSPAGGAMAPWDTPVSFVYSSGAPSTVTIPNVVGDTQAAAIAALSSMPWGWAMTTQSSQTVAAGVVISQNPPAGSTQLGFGQPVSFVVSSGTTAVPNYAYLSQFGEETPSQYQQFTGVTATQSLLGFFLQGPIGLAIDSISRNIFVGGGDGRIQVFNSNGNYQSYFGGFGLGPIVPGTTQADYFGTSPQGGLFTGEGPSTGGQIAIDPVNHNIVGVDSVGQRVLIFNSAGVFQSAFGSAGQGPGQFAFTVLSGIAVDPVSENIVVADSGNNRVQIFNSGGVYQSQFGTTGGGDGQFQNSPGGLAIDPNSRNIVVADGSANNRVQIFNSAGTYLSQFGGPGSGNGNFTNPEIIAIDPATSNIAVSAYSQPLIQIFTPTGTFLTQFGGSGLGNGQVGVIYGMAFDPVCHDLVVADNNARVEIFAGAATPSCAGTTSSSPSTPSVSLTSSTTTPTFGQSVTFTATVTGNNPTGTIQFQNGAGTLGAPVTLNNGTATYTSSSLPVGTDTISAVYSGDSNNVADISPLLNVTVSAYPATVSLLSLNNPVRAGQPVTFTATVSGSNPTGTVQFLNGAATLGVPVPLTGNTASYTTSTLPVGTDSITAVYSGDANNATATSSPVSETVSLAATSTAVASSNSRATFGQPVTFTASVSGDSPTGTVRFLDGSTSLAGPLAMTGGVAAFTTSSLTSGTHSITAIYSGDSFNATSTSPVLTELVSLNEGTTTTVVASSNPITTGQSVTFTATVTGNTPTGTIQFLDGSTSLASPIAMTGGVAVFTTSSLTYGTHPIVAFYSGDNTNAQSTSAALNEVVTHVPTTTTVGSSLNPAAPGQPVTLTAVVAGDNPTGTIMFMDGSNPLLPPAAASNLTFIGPSVNPQLSILSGGKTSVTISNLTAGTHSITAIYSGDGSNAGSTSAVLSQVIQSAPPPVVTPPAAISIPATQANGATSSASPALAAFLAGATATSTLPTAPVQLAPQVSGLAVNGSTVFPIGTTTVTFSFQDSNGNVGTATSTVTVSLGTPRITGSTAGIGSDPSGAIYVNLVLTNTGTGNAQNLQIKTLTLRTLSGTGTVTYNTTLSPALPLTLGNLSVGASITTKIYLNVPSTVTRFSITESGPVQDVAGDNYNYSTAEGVVP